MEEESFVNQEDERGFINAVKAAYGRIEMALERNSKEEEITHGVLRAIFLAQVKHMKNNRDNEN